jgi:hypothetical protein
LVYIEERIVRVTMKPEFPIKAYVQAYIIHYHDPMGFAMREA